GFWFALAWSIVLRSDINTSVQLCPGVKLAFAPLRRLFSKIYLFNRLVITDDRSFLIHSSKEIGRVRVMSPFHVLSFGRMISGKSLSNSKVMPDGPGALFVGAFDRAFRSSSVVIHCISFCIELCGIGGVV
ncbi:hypothetical protein ROZALSC1DRAFT_26168, partial [Rozella allomycis CSF55]